MQFYLDEMAAYQLGPFTFGQLAFSFGIVLLTLLIRGFLTKIFFANLRLLASRTKWTHDDRFIESLDKPTTTFMLIFGIYLATIALPLDEEWGSLLETGFRGISIFIIFWGLLRLSDVIIDVLSDLSARTGTDSLIGFAPLIKKSFRVFIILVGIVMVIDNLGYNVGGIIATLGIGGAAFAFAAKDTIANLYGSIALAMDRPFKVGDWIQVGNGSIVDGDVESIGLRSTKIRTWPKTVVSIPNAVLANEMINNFTRMPKRRVKQVVGVTYSTTPETMVKIVESIRKLLREDEDVNQEFILVNWTDFGESSLDILVYYFSNTTKWLEYMSVRERINVKIAQTVLDHGSSVAFPTRTLHLDGFPQENETIETSGEKG